MDFSSRFNSWMLLALISALGTGCAQTVSFTLARPGLTGIGRDIGLEFGNVAFEVNLDLVDVKQTAVVRKKNAIDQAAPTDSELFGPVVEQEIRRNLESRREIRILSQATHTMDFSGTFYARDTTSEKKEDIKLDNRVVDVRVTHFVDRIYELTLRYSIRSAATGSLLGEGKKEGVRTMSGSGQSVEDAMRYFEPWETNLELLARQAVSRIMEDILPRQERVQRRLREGDGKELRASVDLAVREGLDAAWPLWRDLLGQGGLSPRDKAALLYDSAVYHESRDEVSVARELFDNCLAITSDPWCAEGGERMKSRERELMQMQ